MIKANELRIGNFVEGKFESGPGILPLLAIDLNAIVRNPDCANPIPLTPELLELCGFKDRSGKMANRMGFGLQMNSVDEICWYVQDGFIRYQTMLNGFTRSFEHIKYLHQLQNFYFALTGQELNIKL